MFFPNKMNINTCYPILYDPQSRCGRSNV